MVDKFNNRTVASVVPAGFVGVIKSNVAAPGVACREAGVGWLPGAFTPTEIALAERNGATFVKQVSGSGCGAAQCELATAHW